MRIELTPESKVIALLLKMSSINTNYTNSHETKEGSDWGNAGSEHQKTVRKTRTWIQPASSEMTCCNSNENVIEQNISDSRKNLTRQSSKKKTNWYKLSEFSTSAWGSSTKEKSIPSKSTSLKNHNSHDMQNTFFLNNEAQSNISKVCSPNPKIECSFDKTNDAAVDTEKDKDNNFTIDIEEKRRLRRERQKVKKEIKRQEKAIQREEEVRKKRLAPKDQKVTIINHSTLDRFLVKDSTQCNVETKGNTYSSCEFPALEEVISAASWTAKHKKNGNKREKSNVTAKGVSTETQGSENVERTDSSASQSDNLDRCINSGLPASGTVNTVVHRKSLQIQTNLEVEQTVEDFKKVMKLTEDKPTGKRPKRRDPIQLDINEILKVQEMKHEVAIKQHTNKISQKTEVARYSGNILDSDNPERKRGKQREVPKAKKPSNLKQIILQERAQRKEARHQNVVKPMFKSEEINSPNDKENSHNDELLISNEASNIHIQKELVESTENELKEYSENCNTSSSRNADVQKDELIHLQLEIVPSIELYTDSKKCKNSEIQQNQSENPVSQNVCVETSISNEYNGSKCQPNPQTNEIISVDQNKSPTHKLHSRKFRDYCDHLITPEILKSATALLEDIIKFHDRQFARSPLKASAKRRHVTGLKEVRRFLALRRVRLLVIAPDLEASSTAGGLDDIVAQLKEVATANNIPYVFALGRRQLGYILKKKVPVSCVGVLNYDGTEQNFHNLMPAVEKAREDYLLKVSLVSPPTYEPRCEINENEETQNPEEDVNRDVVASLLAKLNTLRDTPSPFLDAIERCNSSDSDGDDNQVEE